MEHAKFKSTSEWLDDQKAAVLFAPFREKSLNPHSWDKKMNFWTAALEECATIQNEITMDINAFCTCFERQGRYPKCLNTVVGEMVRTGKLITLSEFNRQNNSWTQWGVDVFLRRPVSWGLSKLLSSPSTQQEEVFVFPEQLKKAASRVLSLHYSQVQHDSTDNLLELAAFQAQCRALLSSQRDMDLVIKQLQLDGKLLLARDKEGTQIVKVCKQSEAKVQPVQDMELNIFRLQKVMKHLEQQIEGLSKQSDNLTAEARKMVREQKKSAALHQLRKRKTVLRQIEKKSTCVDTLHDIIHKIEESSSNEMVVSAYESGVSAIKQSMGEATLNKAYAVMDDLQQVLEEQEEVNQSLASLGAGLDGSTDQLELELDTLLAEDALPDIPDVEHVATGFSSFSLDDLPDVPAGSPGKTSDPSPPGRRLHRAL